MKNQMRWLNFNLAIVRVNDISLLQVNQHYAGNFLDPMRCGRRLYL